MWHAWYIFLFSWAISVNAGARTEQVSLDALTDIERITLTVRGSTLHAVARAKEPQATRPELYYLISVDAGVHWKKTARLTNPQDPPILSKSRDSLRLDLQGSRRVVVWLSQGQIPGTGELAVAYSPDQGKTWRRGRNPATADTSRNQSYPDIAIDALGNTHLVWLDDREERGNTQGLRYAESRDGGQNWLPEQTLDALTCTCCWTRLILVANRIPAVLYRGSDPHDMKLRTRSYDRHLWQPARIAGRFDWHFSGCPHCGGDLVATLTRYGKSRLHAAVWTGKPGQAGLYFLHSTDNGGHWQSRRIAGENSRNPVLAARNDRQLGLVYTEGSPSHQIILFTHSENAGKTWRKPLVIHQSDTRIESPQLVAINNRYKVFWTEKRTTGTTLLSRQVNG